MKIIDSDNYAAAGIETLFFPGGEPHARIPKDFGPALLFLKARTWNDVGVALCVLGALRNQGDEVWLFAAYFPGARQDRTDGQTPVTAMLIYSMFEQVADRIYTFDAHSSVIASRVDKNFMPTDLEFSLQTNTCIIVPDAGALERCADLENSKGWGNPLTQCEKHRDFATGRFTGFKMPPLKTRGLYLIVDDICDGGGTFNLLAQEFEKDPLSKDSRLLLWVSHGIFSKGIAAIHPRIEQIITTDSWHRPDNDPRVQVWPLQPIIDKIIQEYTSA